jgi:hypothetical protein
MKGLDSYQGATSVAPQAPKKLLSFRAEKDHPRSGRSFAVEEPAVRRHHHDPRVPHSSRTLRRVGFHGRIPLRIRQRQGREGRDFGPAAGPFDFGWRSAFSAAMKALDSYQGATSVAPQAPKKLLSFRAEKDHPRSGRSFAVEEPAVRRRHHDPRVPHSSRTLRRVGFHAPSL